MRKMKFRGQLRSGVWVYGGFYCRDGEGRIMPDNDTIPFAVNVETVGQFTGLLDRDGREIYEGDILTVPEQYPFFVDNQPNYRAVVEWCYAAWYAPLYSVSSSNAGCAVGGQLDEDGTDEGQRADWLIIGNIHENPDLLKADVSDPKTAQNLAESVDESVDSETTSRVESPELAELRAEVARMDKARSDLAAHIEACTVQASEFRAMGKEFEASMYCSDAMAHAYRLALEMLQPLPPPATEEQKK